MPLSAQSQIRMGFALASSLSEEQKKKFIEIVFSELAKGGGTFEAESFSAATDLPRRDVNRVLAAFSSTIALLTQRPASVSEFVELARGKLFNTADEATARAVAETIIARRSELGSKLNKGLEG
jgi:hypothetical protein